jgi:hypothetical protein
MEILGFVFGYLGWLIAIPLTIFIKKLLDTLFEESRTAIGGVRFIVLLIIYSALVVGLLLLAYRLGYNPEIREPTSRYD